MVSKEEAQRQHGTTGVAGSLPRPANVGVVVVDLVEGFTNPLHPPGADLDSVVADTRTLLDAARLAGRPVWFTTIAYPEGGGSMSTWLAKMPALTCLTVGSPLVEVDGRLAPRPDEPVIVKQAASAFFGTDLGERIRAAGCDGVLITGATTSGCVRATVVDACSHDIPTFVVRPCVGDRASAPHESSLVDMEAKYADVIGLEDALSLVGSP